jgi:hypothetical protein
MIDILPSDPMMRELKWDHLVTFSIKTPLRPNLKEPALILDMIARNFLRNIQRIQWMILTPSLVGDLTIHIQRHFDIAELNLTGLLPATLDSSQNPRRDEIAALAQNFFRVDTQEILAAVGTPEYEQFFLNAIKLGTQPVTMLAGEGAPARQGIEAMLSSSITGTWTAVETMLGDLWEAALNIHPKTLAELKGKRKRFQQSDTDNAATPPDDQDEPDSESLKSVPLNEILRREFDINNWMGSVLRTRRRFDHLAGIREAYALAFSKDFNVIDSCLKNDVLDSLNAVRNLIVHRSSIVDATYERRAKHLTIPAAPIGFPIFLDGEIVRDLMNAAIICSLQLIVAVDDWIAAN